MRIFTSTPVSTASYLLSAFFLFVFTSVACAETPTDSLNKDSQIYLSFYETVDGEKIHWEANFFGGDITFIYKNGKRIPDDLVRDYKDKVYDQLDDMRFGGKKFTFRMPAIVGDDFHFDMEELHKDIEKMKKDLPKQKEHFKFYQFDNEEFEKEMDELKKELEENKSKIYKWKFDEEKFKEEMEELEKSLKENLPKLKDFHFNFELEEEDGEV
jgi:spermidine/putrescine-binding protein